MKTTKISAAILTPLMALAMASCATTTTPADPTSSPTASASASGSGGSSSMSPSEDPNGPVTGVPVDEQSAVDAGFETMKRLTAAEDKAIKSQSESIEDIKKFAKGGKLSSSQKALKQFSEKKIKQIDERKLTLIDGFARPAVGKGKKLENRAVQLEVCQDASTWYSVKGDKKEQPEMTRLAYNVFAEFDTDLKRWMVTEVSQGSEPKEC
ncbi:hypothetical protein FQA45_15855 [Glutamicibacter halophytocola]|uniref:Secreted protein n=1 Tax=Glutamicibacter halophytocola TaxID=1933880 RepID=A0ABX5YDB0_9MICC|nr:hypothetical protein [Glutamicibacter halophytocola]QDY67660.1 hypothetical protein FQA45_15855 [Glutamicibacter halophytocola]